jgi:hypothetical protein
MKQLLISVFVTLALGVSSVSGQNKSASHSFSNSDIIEMSRAGVPQNAIAAAIQSTPVNFDVSPQSLIALHAGGVDGAVIALMINASTRQKFASSFGVATGTFPVKDAVGHMVRFSARIKSENVLNGYAGLWWRVDGEEKGKALSFDNSEASYIGEVPTANNGIIRGATGTSGWTQYRLELPVPTGTTNINFGLLLTGTGTAWFDALRIELDDAPYINPQRFDLDFESTTAKGFYTGGNGYRVGVDNTTSWTGSQSLKMQFIGDGGEAKTTAVSRP